MSAAEPGGKPMINRIGCEGKSPACPCATAATAPSAKVKPKVAIRCMAVLPVRGASYAQRALVTTFAYPNRIGETILPRVGSRCRPSLKTGAARPFFRCSIEKYIDLCPIQRRLGAARDGALAEKQRS